MNKTVLAAAAALAFVASAAAPAFAQDATEEAATPKFSVDTPIETLAADPRAKAVLDADMPTLLTHPSYEYFKGMSLRQLQPMSEGKITDELLTKVGSDLGAIKDEE